MTSANQTTNNLFVEINSNDINNILNIQNNINNPFHLGFAVDISGSMGTNTEFINDEGIKEMTDLKYLDLVKHCIKIIIEALIQYDSYILSLVVFNNNTYPIIISKLINKETKNEIFKSIMKLKPSGTTNIWSPILTLNQIFKDKIDNLPSKLILFTDGVSNVNPPRGIIYELNRWNNDNNMKIPIHVLGFGYNLDNKILTEIANITNGSFNYIPSTGEMLTVMIHLASRLILEKFKTFNIILKYNEITNEEISHLLYFINKNNIKINKEKLEYFDNINCGPVDIEIDVGSICSDKTFVLNSNSNNIPKVFIEVINNYESTTKEEHICKELIVNVIEENYKTECHIIRNKFIKILENMYNNSERDKFEKNKELYKNCIELFDTEINDVYEYESDLIGEIKLAILDENNFNKWGKYYIPSLIGAYRSQICNSFRDPGIQTFIKDDFRNLRDKLNNLCDELPPPIPSCVLTTDYNNSQYQSQPSDELSRTVTMRQYESGGCFGGNSLVKIPNGYKSIKNLKKGDSVVNNEGKISYIECIVKYNCNKNMLMCVFDNNFTITPYHPIVNNNNWKFPINIIEPINIECDYIYNIILNDRKSIYINETICCTLGHNLDGNIIYHNYFGTNNIINNLKNKFPNEYNDGLITSIKRFIRNDNNEVCGCE